MAVGEQGYLLDPLLVCALGQGFSLGNHPLTALLHVSGAFPTRTAIAPLAPVGVVFADLGSGDALVAAVIPFLQVGAGLRLASQTRQGAGALGPL